MHYKIFNTLLLCFILINCSKKEEETLSTPQEFDNEISVDDDYYFEKNIYQCFADCSAILFRLIFTRKTRV